MKIVEEKSLAEVMEDHAFWSKMARVSSYLPIVLPIVGFVLAMFFS